MNWRWLKVAALGAALVLAGAPTLERRPAGGPLEITIGADHAEARAGSGRSSGGYSRPSSGGYSRTPSFGSGGVTRTPSTSGGYGRPSTSGGGSSYAPAAPSAGDRAMSRQSSGDALGRYRQQQQPPAVAPSAPSYGTPGRDQGGYDYGSQRRGTGGWGSGGWGSGGGSYGNRGYGGGGFGSWTGARGWSAPPYAYRSPPRFGIWDGLFLWFMLDNLTRPGYSDFFHNQQNDPGYQQWRAEADRLAADNADLRAKLNSLDQSLSTQADKPRDPNYLPPDTPRDVALADAANTVDSSTDTRDGSGGFGVVAIILVVGGVVFLVWLWRKQQGARPARSGGSGSMSNLRTAGNILRQKISGETYTPSLFRVGMTLTLDPTPFILAAGTTKVAAPAEVSGDNMLTSAATVSTVTDGAATLHRLYLPEEKGFFQIHLNTAGQPDECRFFSLLDEIHPGSEDEWSFWLDPAEGMIGWPEFQTKDGKVYPRAWTPGAARVKPHTLYENGTDVKGVTVRTLNTMLYAASTGAPDPAPPTEYIMVSAVERGGQAWVEIHAGIDINPATLSLA